MTGLSPRSLVIALVTPFWIATVSSRVELRPRILETHDEAAVEVWSATGSVAKSTLYDTLGGGPEYPGVAGQTFPLAAFQRDDRVFGVIGDSPGNWENRCLVRLDPEHRRLAVLNGDGRDPYELRIRYDAK